MDKTEQKVYDLLRGHIGKKSAIDAGKIAKIVGIKDNATHINTRNIITHVLRKTDLPIGSTTSHGYFVMSNKDEICEYEESLDHRMLEILSRKVKASENYRIWWKEKPLPSQIEIVDD